MAHVKKLRMAPQQSESQNGKARELSHQLLNYVMRLKIMQCNTHSDLLYVPSISSSGEEANTKQQIE